MFYCVISLCPVARVLAMVCSWWGLTHSFYTAFFPFNCSGPMLIVVNMLFESLQLLVMQKLMMQIHGVQGHQFKKWTHADCLSMKSLNWRKPWKSQTRALSPVPGYQAHCLLLCVLPVLSQSIPWAFVTSCNHRGTAFIIAARWCKQDYTGLKLIKQVMYI